MTAAVVVAAILTQTGLFVQLQMRTRRHIVSIEARLDAMIARLDLFDARLAARTVKKNGGDHVAADRPHPIGMRQ
jgi:hypothetical protein